MRYTPACGQVRTPRDWAELNRYLTQTGEGGCGVGFRGTELRAYVHRVRALFHGYHDVQPAVPRSSSAIGNTNTTRTTPHHYTGPSHNSRTSAVLDMTTTGDVSVGELAVQYSSGVSLAICMLRMLCPLRLALVVSSSWSASSYLSLFLLLFC